MADALDIDSSDDDKDDGLFHLLEELVLKLCDAAFSRNSRNREKKAKL